VNIKDMTKENMAAILESLMKDGKIMEVDIIATMNPAPSEEMKGICDLIHGFLCTKAHGDKQGECDYYIEDALFEGWSLPTHRQWLQEIGKLMKTYDIASISDLTNALRAVASLVRELSEVRSVSVNRYRLVATVVHGYLTNELKKITAQASGTPPLSLPV
jgi:hypothetical protein